jgi:hypothetical protein
VTSDEAQVRRLMGGALKLKPLRGENWGVTPPEVIRDVWVKIQAVSGNTDPFSRVKAEQNRAVLELYPFSKDLVLKSRDPLLEAVKLSIAGNSMDAMRPPKEQPTQELIESLVEPPIRPEDVEGLKERLGEARRIVYLGDNCGEIVFDKLLIELIRETYGPEVVFVTRTLPVLNDAILQDALSVGIDTVVQVVENGITEPFTGTTLEKVSPEVRALIEGSDLVISKGGGNYDTLTEEEEVRGKVTFFLQAKCHVYCTIHQVPLGALIVHNS